MKKMIVMKVEMMVKEVVVVVVVVVVVEMKSSLLKTFCACAVSVCECV